MAFEEKLPEWKAAGVEPPASKREEGWKASERPSAEYWNWQMSRTYKALKEIQEKAAEQEDVTQAAKDAKDYTDQKVKDIDLSKITPESIGATKKADFDAHVTDGTKHVTTAERNTWNAKETTDGAQQKANAAETSAKNYVNGLQWQRKRVSDDDGNAIVVSDLNADLTTGWYMGSNMANAPTSEWFWVEIIRHNDLWTVQNAYCFNRQSYYQRMKINGNWTPWSQDLFQSGVNAKRGTVDALNSKGIAASTNEPWADLNNKIKTLPTGSVLTSNSSNEVAPYDLKTFSNLFYMPWTANYMTISFQENTVIRMGDNASPTNHETRSRYTLYARNDFGQKVAFLGWQNTEYSSIDIRPVSMWISKPDKGGWVMLVSADFQASITRSKVPTYDDNFRWEGTLYFDLELHGGNHASYGKSTFTLSTVSCTSS